MGVVASAPAKIILFGEHFVVYGEPAIVLAIDKRAYAFAPVAGTTSLEETELLPGQEKVFRVALAVADSPLAAFGVIASLSGPTGEVLGAVSDSDGQPAIHGSLMVEVAGRPRRILPADGGTFAAGADR